MQEPKRSQNSEPADLELRKWIRTLPYTVQAIIQVESSGNPFAVSSVGAKGLMQLMPAICTAFDVKDPFDPVDNVRGGTLLLKEEIRRFQIFELVVAAYNAGSPRIFRAIRDAQSHRWELVKTKLPVQTVEYVPKVLKALTEIAIAGIR